MSADRTRLSTLAEINPPSVGEFILRLRCYACGELIPLTASAEEYSTPDGRWVVAECPRCQHWTPKKLEIAS